MDRLLRLFQTGAGRAADVDGAFAEGRPSPLADLGLQFADYAAFQRRWLEGPEARAQGVKSLAIVNAIGSQAARAD